MQQQPTQRQHKKKQGQKQQRRRRKKKQHLLAPIYCIAVLSCLAVAAWLRVAVQYILLWREEEDGFNNKEKEHENELKLRGINLTVLDVHAVATT